MYNNNKVADIWTKLFEIRDYSSRWWNYTYPIECMWVRNGCCFGSCWKVHLSEFCKLYVCLLSIPSVFHFHQCYVYFGNVAVRQDDMLRYFRLRKWLPFFLPSITSWGTHRDVFPYSFLFVNWVFGWSQKSFELVVPDSKPCLFSFRCNEIVIYLNSKTTLLLGCWSRVDLMSVCRYFTPRWLYICTKSGKNFRWNSSIISEKLLARHDKKKL